MPRPNILVLISDQHSRHHLGCYGDQLVRTPHLDRLAAAEERTATFSEHGPTRNDAPSRMIRRGRWKLYKYGDDTPAALFDLEGDPDELRDLGRSREHGDLREALLGELCQDWDPEEVQERSDALARDMAVLNACGRAVQPPAPDALPVPDVESFTPR